MKRFAAAIGVVALGGTLALGGPAGLALAQAPGPNVTALQVVSLNKYALAQTGKLSGRTTVFTEDATWVGGWTQSQYKRIIGSTVDASQIYNRHMVTVVNNLGKTTTMVTWTRTMPAPFNTRAGASGKIRGKPYSNPFGSGKTRRWSNRWRSQ